MLPKWSRSCAITQIKTDVEENNSLTKVLDFFFPQQQSSERPEKSVKFITTVFVHWFSLLLPEKGKHYIQTFLNAEKIDEDFVIDWIDTVYGHKSNQHLDDLLKKSPFYLIFDDLKVHNVTIHLTKFYQKLRSQFRACFLEAKQLQGILEVYRCLLYCKTKTKRSKLFCKAVKLLWKKLNFKNDILIIEPADDSLPEDDTHTYLLKIVEKLGEGSNEKIKDKIKEIFAKDNTSFTIDNQKLIISSYKIVLTNIFEEMTKKIDKNDFEIKEVEFVANEIILDQNFVLPGKNLTLITKSLTVPFSVEIDLSGKDAIDKYELIPAETGKLSGENGKNGKDGLAGQSAGNCTIIAETVNDKDNLQIILNGGNGSKGQDGGDGANGEDGKGVDVNVINKHKITIIAKSVVNIATGGNFSRTMDKESETIESDGTKLFSNDSANYLTTHSYRLYEGSDGKPGGKPGKNGLGGQGGEGGEFKLTLNNCVKNDIIKVTSIKGHNGENGVIGNYGHPGLKGWDIAITAKTLRKGKIYGSSKKEKLRIEYFKEIDEDTVFVSQRNTAEYDFKCYAKIVSEELQRTQLKNRSNEKISQKEESERSQESMARKMNPIDEESAKEKYQELTHSVLNATLEEQQEAETEYEEVTEINRLYEIYNFEFEQEYQPKRQFEPRTITVEEINEIQKTKEGWEFLWKFPAPSCFSFEQKLRKIAPNDEINMLMTKKTLINNLRDGNNDDENLKLTREALIEKFITDFDYSSNQYKLDDLNKFIASEEVPIKEKFEKLSNFLNNEDEKYISKKLKLLYLNSKEIGLSLINTLLLIFECEGIHSDLETLNFLIETAFHFSNSGINQYLFPSILLNTKQSDWIDKLFLLLVDYIFTASLEPEMKQSLKDVLNEFVDENLKVLFMEKLIKGGPENRNLKGQILSILKLIKSSTTIFPLLENVPLKNWITVIEQHNNQHVIEEGNFNISDPETKRLAIFWYGKLIEKFDQDTVKPLDEIIARFVASQDKNIVDRFFQRLINNDVICGSVDEKNLKEILECSLNIEETKFNKDGNENESNKIAKELLSAPKKDLRDLDNLQILCQKLNKSSSSNICFTIIDAMKEPLDPLIAFQAVECFEKLQKKDFTYDFSLPAFEAFLLENNRTSKNSEMKYFLFLLEIIDQVIHDQRGFRLRHTQKLAILTALNNKDADNKMKSVLQQISTGEGKTLIIAALSIILVLKNPTKLKVNIVTSSPVLAKREIESSNGCLALYEAFGIKAGHICHESEKRRTLIYKECDIIYGDLTVYQSDYLQHNFLSKNILGERGYDIVIVDEVDSMLLDNAMNMLYLSHDIAELELLRPIFTKIWQFVNLRLNGEIEGCKEDEKFYQRILSSFFPSISWEEFPQSIDIDVEEATKLKKKLIEKKIVDENGRILVSNKKYLKHLLWSASDTFQKIPSEIENRFLCFYNAIMKEEHIPVPKNLHKYVINHLKDFIGSAEAAFEMIEGINYQIETVSNLYSQTLESRIVIIDSDTGVDLPTTQWTKGLHQFLQLKHGLRLTPISTKAVYISNVSYLKKYEKDGFIFGFTGTLGAEAEKQELIEFYNLKCITLPSSFPKQFHEEPAILAENEETYFMQIFNTLNNLMKSGRSALVIADSIKLVTILHQKMKKIAEKQRLEGHELKPFLEATVYKRDYEILEYADGTKHLPPRTIIFSTNLAGRGTDIKITKDLEENGGLHVIVAFLPQNIRIEEQAFGRAARCGEPGTAQMIVFEKDQKSFLELKKKRNQRENERIQKIKEHYITKIKREEACFLVFSETLKNVKRKLQERGLPSECYEILCKDIIDQYAMELDSVMDGDNWEQKIEEFCKKLEAIYGTNADKTVLPLQPSNLLRYAVKMAYDKKIDEANLIFEKLGFSFPEYLPETKYYSAIFAIKKRENPALLDFLEGNLKEAKNGFFERLKFYANIDISDNFGVSDDEGLFYNDDFQKQQQQCEYLTLSIIQSIDEFLGQLVEPMDFVCDTLREEASMLVYANLSNYENSPIITGYKVCKNFDEDKLQEYCQENGVNFEMVKNDLKKGEEICEEHLRGLFEIKSYQDFWEALKANFLLDKIRTESFIDVTKLSIMTEEVIRGCIVGDIDFEDYLLQYPNIKKWKRLSNTKDIQADLRRCMEDNNVIKTTEFGKLRDRDRDFEATLLLSPWITSSDICAYGISEDNAQKLLALMVESKILIQYNSKNGYKLSHEFLPEKYEIFPKWCYQIMTKMIKTKFAYVFAYQSLISKVAKENNFNQLPDKTDITFINELMEIGVLECYNVNLDGLKKPVPNGNIFDKGCGFLLDRNPAQHYYKALSATQGTIKKTFTKPRHHKSIISNSSKEQIENILKEKAPAKQKYENLDIHFIPIQEALNNLNIDGIRVKPVTHSLPYLISPSEMKWSKKTILTLGVVGSGAALQLAAGVSLVIVTFGLGAFAGKFLITEGISDVFFCAKTLWNGKSGNFIRYKTASMALNVALCGLTEPLKYVKEIPSILSRDAVKIIRRADVFISGGGALLKTLIPSLTKIETCETTKNFISQGIEFTVAEVNARITLILGEIFGNSKELKISMNELFQKIGVQNGEKVLEGQGDMILREIEPSLKRLFSVVVSEVNKKFIRNSTINLTKYSTVIGGIMQSQKIEQSLNLFKQNLNDSISKTTVMVKRKTVESDVKDGVKNDETSNVQSISKIIETWKLLLENRFKHLMEERLLRPLNDLNSMDYQNQLREIVNNATKRSIKSHHQRTSPQALTSHDHIIQKIKNQYFLELENFLETTKNAMAFAELTLTTARNHQISVNSLARLISAHLKKPITINIKCKDANFIGSTNNIIPGTSREKISLIQPNEDNNAISNLYEQIRAKVDERRYPNLESFKNALAEIIKADIEFQQR